MGKVVIDKQRCKGCELCVVACPKGLLKIVADEQTKNGMTAKFEGEDACSGCAICAKSCPDYAILEVYR